MGNDHVLHPWRIGKQRIRLGLDRRVKVWVIGLKKTEIGVDALEQGGGIGQETTRSEAGRHISMRSAQSEQQSVAQGESVLGCEVVDIGEEAGEPACGRDSVVKPFNHQLVASQYLGR